MFLVLFATASPHREWRRSSRNRRYGMPLTGSLMLNGVSDAQLIIILQHKEKGQHFSFTAQTLQPVAQPQGQPTVYNTATLSWGTDDGFRAIRELLAALLA